MIYLASPYSDQSPTVRHWRFCAAVAAVQRMTGHDLIAFSPVAVSVPMVLNGVRPWDDPWWYEWSMAFLKRSDELWILPLDGWDRSAGVKCEIVAAHDLGIQVVVADELTDTENPLT
jgi:hypothetical protein